MKPRTAFACLLMLTAALAQQDDSPRPNGTIYGIAIGQEGKPAKGIGLQAEPLGVALGAVLPRTTTNERGEYRFVNIPWWGRYRVCVEDEVAGYSTYTTGCGQNEPPEVELTPERPEAELRVHLPPKAGFLRVNLSNRKTGAAIPAMRVVVTSSGNPPSLIFSMSCYSTKVVLLPPDKDVLLHVTSDGFREWTDSVGRGKPLRLASGARLTLDVQLDPSD